MSEPLLGGGYEQGAGGVLPFAILSFLTVFASSSSGSKVGCLSHVSVFPRLVPLIHSLLIAEIFCNLALRTFLPYFLEIV